MQRQRTLQLQEANLEMSRAEEMLAKLERFLTESAEAESKQLGAGCSAAELQFASVLRERMQVFRLELEADARRREILRQKALGEYRQAYRDRESLESLRARQLGDYQREQSRREQQEVDSNYLLQRWHRRT